MGSAFRWSRASRHSLPLRSARYSGSTESLTGLSILPPAFGSNGTGGIRSPARMLVISAN